MNVSTIFILPSNVVLTGPVKTRIARLYWVRWSNLVVCSFKYVCHHKEERQKSVQSEAVPSLCSCDLLRLLMFPT